MSSNRLDSTTFLKFLAFTVNGTAIASLLTSPFIHFKVCGVVLGLGFLILAIAHLSKWLELIAISATTEADADIWLTRQLSKATKIILKARLRQANKRMLLPQNADYVAEIVRRSVAPEERVKSDLREAIAWFTTQAEVTAFLYDLASLSVEMPELLQPLRSEEQVALVNCKYYSGFDQYLKCAPNPSGDCRTCRHYEPKKQVET